MKKFIAVLLFSSATASLWCGPITIEESSTDKGSTVYREKRWLRDGEKILAEGWIVEKSTNRQQIHTQEIYVSGKSVMVFSKMKEYVAVTSAESEYMLSFKFSEIGVLGRISVVRGEWPFQSYVRRADGFYDPVEEPNQRPERNAGAASSSPSTPSSGMAHP